MKKLFFLSMFLFVIALAGFVLASVSFEGEDLIKTYSGGDRIRGKVNLSFDDVLAEALVESNFEGNITLLELLNENGFSNFAEFNCSTASCSDDYVRGNSVDSYYLNEEGILGLSVQGNNFNEFEQVKFTVRGNSPPSCNPQLKVDLLNDEQNILTAKGYVDEQCFSTKRGCFETNLDSNQYQSATIPSGSQKYCERIELPSGPAYKLGARVGNSASGQADLKMSLLSLSGNNLGSCILPDINQQEQTVECIVEYASTEQQEYYVCINAEASSEYKIDVEFNDPCGTDNPGSQNEEVDYNVFAKNLKFGNPRIVVNSNNFNSATNEDLYNYMRDYISSNYNNMCNPYCVVPIKFLGNNQDLTFSNIVVKYRSSGAGGLQNNEIYETSVEPSKISSGILEIDLAPAEFLIPLGSNENEFELIIDDNEVFDIPITLQGGFDFDISPKFVSFGQETSFSILTSRNVSRSEWDFGEGSKKTVNGKTASYRYVEEGIFNVSVKVTSSNGGISSKNFSVIVGDAESSANKTLKDYRVYLNNVKEDLLSYSTWLRNDLGQILQIEALEGTLSSLEDDYSQATVDDEFKNIMLELVSMDMPSSIESRVNGKLPLGVGIESINTDYLEQVSGTEVEDEENLKIKIGQWMDENLNAEIEFEEIWVKYVNDEVALMSTFEINLNKVSNVPVTYLFIDFSKDQLTFMRDYGAQDVAGGTFIEVGNSDGFEFYVSGEASPQDLRAYVSPSVNELGSYEPILACDYDKRCEKNRGENNENCPTDCRPYGTAIILILIVVLGGVIAFIGMRLWYQRNYENKLFKKRLDLYNITNFVKVAKKKGLSRSKIKSNLKKAGWTGEQIAYAIKKARVKPDAGKKTNK